MKSFDLERLASDFGGEYVLGTKDLDSDACYMIYGIVRGGETDRLVRPGPGYEEILCAVDGPLRMKTPSQEVMLQRAHAVHISGEETLLLSNPSDGPVVYIVAGGRRRDR